MDAIMEVITNLFSDFDLDAIIATITDLAGNVNLGDFASIFSDFDISAIGDMFSGLLG